MNNLSLNQTWFKDWFRSSAYLERYSHRDTNEAKKVILMLSNFIDKSYRDYCLDCACGSGRHLKYLNEQFKKVCGIDLSSTLLLQGKQFYPHIEFIQADLRNIPFKENAFQSIFSLFSSFGYFNDKENITVLKSWHNLLQKNSYLIIDLINPIHLRKTIVSSSNHKTKNYLFQETREIISNRVEKFIEVIPLDNNSKNISSTFSESVRLFDEEELREILFNTGFNTINVIGNYDGELLDKNSLSHDRMIFICRKK